MQYRVRLVHFRTSVINQLYALAMGQELCRRKKQRTVVRQSELDGLAFSPWANRGKQELLERSDRLSPSIEELDQAVKQEAESNANAVCLMKQSGVGPVTALAFVLTHGPINRFPKS
jgi:transposase